MNQQVLMDRAQEWPSGIRHLLPEPPLETREGAKTTQKAEIKTAAESDKDKSLLCLCEIVKSTDLQVLRRGKPSEKRRVDNKEEQNKELIT